jgi:4-alpha-glucanotransferase
VPEGRFADGRHAGTLVPLFSIPSRASWGVGEITDLPLFARWLDSAGFDFVQILPVNEMADGQNSPYSALSAMAIDPIYIGVGEVEEFAAAGGEAALPPDDRATLEQVRSSPSVGYADVRRIKWRALRAAFERFERTEWCTDSARARKFRDFVDREGWWLADYTLFRALHDEHSGRYWLEWEEGLRNREPGALDAARQRLAPEIRYRAWLQWIAEEQWQRARREAAPVGVFGDFPFVVSAHSADVWARQHEFRLDASVGTPPDAFSATGQDWGLPVYRWDVMAAGNFEWLRQRARRSAGLYDGYRVDHLIGFYRTYFRERDGHAAFVPPDEPSQRAQGEQLLQLFKEPGAQIVAEDLGSVPDFLRESLGRMRVPGYKVLRWEREWDAPGRPFKDPAAYPVVSLATSATHDTETLAGWWDEAPLEDREAAMRWPALSAAGCDPAAAFDNRLRDALLQTLAGAASRLMVLPVQDIFGWRDRINTPAVVDEINWTWRMPWPVDDLAAEPVSRERAAFLRQLSTATGRYLR